MSATTQVTRNDWDQWWRTAVIYQVYPRSFNDTDGDGLGDIRGIIERLDYLQRLGVDAIWLSPHYPSPQADAGYDVSDYFDVNPEYGSLEEFKELIADCHERGMRIIVDLVPNHCSYEHAWFQEALAAPPNSPERERFIFRHSVGEPPNNWGSMFGGSAWSQVYPLTKREEDKDWWYLHLFAPEQPDFNWDNPEVHEFFRNFLRFWCDLGIDGFRVDVAHGLVKAPGLPDDEIGPDRWSVRLEHPELTDMGPYFDQDGVHDIYREWRQVLDEYGRDRMMVAEAWVDPPSRGAMYVRGDEMSQAFNFDYLKAGWDAQKIRSVIDQTRREMGAVGAPVTWVLSNHDVVRHPSRFGLAPGESAEAGIGWDDPQPDRELGLRRGVALSLFTFGLPGSVYIYQGEELGLPEVTDMPDEARQDPTYFRTEHKIRGRDGCRVPLPWEAEKVAAASTPSWLPRPDYWAEYAADVAEKDPNSVLSLYRRAIALRHELQLGAGDFSWDERGQGEVLAVRNGNILLLVNMGNEAATVASSGKVVISTGGVENAAGQVRLPGASAAWIEEE